MTDVATARGRGVLRAAATAARWVGRGERRTTATLDALADDIADLTGRVDALDAADGLESSAAARPRRDPWWSPAELGDGVNVIGYLQHQSGLGDVARRLVALLDAAGVPTAPIAFDGTHAPLTSTAVVAPQRLDHARTIALMAPDQVAVLDDWYPEVRGRTRTVGYCFWELDELPDDQIAGARLLDEVWVPTRFVERAFSAVDGLRVRHVPIPVARPVPSVRPAVSFAPLAGAGDRVVLGITFDHFSSLERKNPLGAIEAFTRAFSDDPSRALLVVKTLNADHLPEAHRRLLDHVGDRRDVVVWDHHLSRADQSAFISHLDVLVSLHRGEGLGLHLAEAMWLGVPVIATGYSGNLDFMDPSCARLVDHVLRPVGDLAMHYRAEATWADPDVDDAARAMRELVDDAAARAELGAAGRRRMADQPSDAATAERIAALLDDLPPR
ncbi:glycosyltransferase [Ilumatobacter sp.]|uniref:glycosyltransferase n=1 Tax=Ilumatobacter sp. TaxID=1967498 RepID=UPI003B523571